MNKNKNLYKYTHPLLLDKEEFEKKYIEI